MIMIMIGGCFFFSIFFFLFQSLFLSINLLIYHTHTVRCMWAGGWLG